MDWLNELRDLRPRTGIDHVTLQMLERLIAGPVSFKSPYWDGEIVIATVDDYLAWARTSARIQKELDAEKWAYEIWEMEKSQNGPAYLDTRLGVTGSF